MKWRQRLVVDRVVHQITVSTVTDDIDRRRGEDGRAEKRLDEDR
jgi:hypothetical protein